MKLLYQLIVLPIESIIEYIFCFSIENFKVLGVPGTLILVSLVVNFLALPLYNIADKQQLKERELQNKLAYRVERIKRGFKGDEQYMILNEYYRQNGYHPLYALRSALSILIEIPFFIAAYHFLSNCTYLNGVSWMGIKDLGTADNVLSFAIGGFVVPINVLPIIMTLINIASSVIYTKNSLPREKIQTYALALVFLILLYDSPAGLVIYWISNNIFSFIKNIVLCSTSEKNKQKNEDEKQIISRPAIFRFLLSSFVLFILAGIVNPSNAINSSPLDFALIGDYNSPVDFVYTTSIYFFGLLVIWPMLIYLLFGNKVKKVMEMLFTTISIIAILDVYIFKHSYGTINNTFGLEKPEYITNTSIFLLICPFIVMAFLVGAYLLLEKKEKLGVFNYILIGMIVAEAFVSISNIRNIQDTYNKFIAETGINPDYEEVLNEDDMDMTLFHLSKTEKNVLVLFMDRALSNYYPYVLEQFPELKESYSGFTYYPNCISFSDWTSCAGPAMFGGYEYTVDAMNSRDDMLLKDKYNEALRVMPKLFSDAGFDVSMVNIPFPNFNEGVQPLEYVYSELEEKGVKAYDMPYKFEKRFKVEHSEDLKSREDERICIGTRNFSIMQMLPPAFRNGFSNGAKYYYDKDNYTPLMTFIEARYGQLLYMPEAFEYDNDKPTFTFIGNDMTHDFTLLREDYSFGTIDSVHPAAGTGNYQQNTAAYHVNVASYLLIDKVIAALKENGAYDNTRIIIISDHGYAVDLPAFKDFDNGTDAASFNPLLLVKDFGATGEPVTDESFVTNAELVNLVRYDIGEVSDTNPYTGEKFLSAKDFESFNVYRMDNWWTEDYQKDYKYPIKDKVAYNIKQNIFVEKNWNRIDTSKE